MTRSYHWPNIRALLNEGFSDQELRLLRYDLPQFKSIFDQLAQNSSKAEIIERLLEYAEQTLQVDILLAWAEEHNSTRYKTHQPYYEETSPSLTTSGNVLSKNQYVPKPACPYPGMVPFSAEDARFFYGREAEIRKMLRHLRYQRYLFVIGPSGSGKSSLVRAGLLPKLKESGLFPKDFWLVREIRLGSEPGSALAQAIGGDPAQPAQTVAHLLVGHPPAQRLLLVVDPFEELFTQADRVKRSRFISALQALRPIPNCALLLVMRTDFYPDLMNSDLWPVEPSQRLEIAPLRGKALRQAIQQPAEGAGVQLEADLVQRLLDDAANEPGALPMIQETMLLLWEEMQDHLLTLNAYERLGVEGRSGLAVAMATKADAVLADLSLTQRDIACRIFLRLVQFGEGRADTRRQLPVTALSTTGDDPLLFEQTLTHLTDNRLLTLSGEEGNARRKVDLAHEALITGWPTLQRWLSERREAEQTRRRLETNVAEWMRLGRGRGGLLDQVELLEAVRWLDSSDAIKLGCGEDLLDLVRASQEAIEEVEQEKEATRQELAAARQLAILGLAMTAIQYRINDTLDIIIPNISRLRRQLDPMNETTQEILDIMERNTRYTSEYIHRIQRPLKEAKVQTIDINACLREAQGMVWQQYYDKAKFRTVEVIYNTDESLPQIEASISQIVEVFQNLIENGYKAMGTKEGILTIVTRGVDNWLEVEIRDTGPGIPVEIRDRLFVKPVPSRQLGQSGQGSGLGLWLSALLLQRYAGEIKIAGTGPDGTTMLVRLPVLSR